MSSSDNKTHASNVLGEPLTTCCMDPVTGFYRDGLCHTGPGDHGLHVLCAQMTEEFLEFSKAAGNDLSTPQEVLGFPGLKPGDRWCLCVTRWKEALDAGVTPPVLLRACHISCLEFVDLQDLQRFAVEED
jgi:uncharacterized protein (DUF2237 family)